MKNKMTKDYCVFLFIEYIKIIYKKIHIINETK